MHSETAQTGGDLTVFDDINPTEVNQLRSAPPIRPFEDMSGGVSNYFHRAQLISTYSWTSASTGVVVSINPYSYMATNAIMVEKLRYFSSFRGTLRLRFIINGTPFHYGRLLASWVPLDTLQTAEYRAKYTRNVVVNYQVQHVSLDPCTSTPMEMVIPFVSDVDAVGLQGQTATSLNDLGTLRVSVANILRSANMAIPDPVSLQIYAWFDDIQYGPPTSELSVLQVGKDESLGNGAVSKISSSVAVVASKFKSIPFIGPFATATEIGANAISGIASIFGFSNPTLVERYHMQKPQTALNYSQAIGRDSSTKYTYDPLAQLSVDPCVAGVSNEDEMSFAKLYKVPFKMRTITWAIADAPGTALAKIGVSPCCTYQTGSVPTKYHTTGPLSLLSMYAGQWTGALKFRFEVITSAYHKGRIQFRYIPRRVGGTYVGYGESTSQTVVLDLGVDSSKELVIGWSQPTLWLNTNPACWSDSTANSDTASGGTVGNCPSWCNGEIIVEVLTTLTAPQLVAPVEINVFMEGTDSLRFANFSCDQVVSLNNAVLQVGPEMVMGNEKCVHLGGPAITPDNFTLCTMGEDVASLRILCKRPTCIGIKRISAASTVNSVPCLVGWGFPLRLPQFHNDTSTPVVNTTKILIPYLTFRNCFMGYRGSVRYKLVSFQQRDNQLVSTTFRRGYITASTEETNSVDTSFNFVNNRLMLSKSSKGWSQSVEDDGVYEVELCDSNPKKFYLSTASNVNFLLNQPDALIMEQNFLSFNNYTINSYGFQVFFSIGEDHSLVKFTGCPDFLQTQNWVSPTTPLFPA